MNKSTPLYAGNTIEQSSSRHFHREVIAWSINHVDRTISIINRAGPILGYIQNIYSNTTLGDAYQMKTLKPGAMKVWTDYPCLPLG